MIMIILNIVLEFNKSTSENVTAQANLARKIDFANFVKKTDFNGKLKK